MPAILTMPEAPILQMALFIVLGVLLAIPLQSRTMSQSKLLAIATILGVLGGFVAEMIQVHTPGRVSSVVDVGVAGAGTLLGAWLGLKLLSEHERR